MRLLLFALAAVASAQLEHSVGEALSWKSLRRAALGDKGAEQLDWKKAKGIPEPGAFPADPAAAAAAAPASAAVESKSRLRGQGRARPSP